jgi:hypothetical protein
MPCQSLLPGLSEPLQPRAAGAAGLIRRVDTWNSPFNFGHFGCICKVCGRFQRRGKGVGPMGGIVTAQYVIGSKSDLDRGQLDQIIKILDIRNAQGQLVSPPVGANCLYKLILEKDDQDVPTNGGNSS